MNTTDAKRAGLAATWIVGLNLLVACAAQIAATLALLQELAGSAVTR